MDCHIASFSSILEILFCDAVLAIVNRDVLREP
jgi:hypothetical protein